VVHKLGKGKYIVQSIPGELSMEETNILNAASNTEQGCVTQSQLMNDLGYLLYLHIKFNVKLISLFVLLSWTEYRAQQSLDKVLGEGLCWIDKQASDEPAYWFPSLFPGRNAQTTAAT